MHYFMYSSEQNPPAGPPSPELMAQLVQLVEDMTKAGVLVTTGALAPKGKHIKLSGGKWSVTDGPFIEVKELMGGFAVINVKSIEEAVEWAKRYRAIIGDGESEIVPVDGPAEFGQA